jgi:hypothetical protein
MRLVRATEKRIRQTESSMGTLWKCGVIRLLFVPNTATRSFLERNTLKGDSPVEEMARMIEEALEYRQLDIWREFGRHQLPTLNTF